MSGQILALGKSSLVYGIGSAATRFVGLLMLPFFTAYLAPADYGVLTILALVTQLAVPVFSLGLGAGMGPCYFSGDEQRKSTTVWTAFSMLTASSAVLGVIALTAAGALSSTILGSSGFASLMQLTLFGVAINVLATPFMQHLQFENRALLYVVLSITATLATIVMSLLLVGVFALGVRGMVFGQLFGYVIGTVAALIFGRPAARPRWSGSVCAELLRLSLPLMPGFAFLFVLVHANKYVLQQMQGLDAVGIYGVGSNLGMASAVLIGAIQTAWYPYFMSFVSQQDVAGPLFGRILSYYVIGVGAIVLLFYLFAQPVVQLLTQPSFHDAYRVIGLTATAQYFIGMFSLLLPPLYFAREVAYVSVAQGVAAAVVVALSVVLIPGLSYLGAALALAIAALCMVVAMAVFQRSRGRRYLRIHYELPRVGGFFAFFVLLAGLLSLPLPFSWKTQSALIPASLVLIAAAIYLSLSRFERLALRETLRARIGRKTTGPLHD